jgi:hypothetical protein
VLVGLASTPVSKFLEGKLRLYNFSGMPTIQDGSGEPLLPAVQEEADGQEDAAGMSAAIISGTMRPDHPLLARAQAALKRQLLAEHQRLVEELRERQIMVNVRWGSLWVCLLP